MYQNEFDQVRDISILRSLRINSKHNDSVRKISFKSFEFDLEAVH